MIEGEKWFVFMEVLDPEESEEDTMAYYYVDSLYEKY